MEDFRSTDFNHEEEAPSSPVLVKKARGDAETASLCSIRIARQSTRLSNQRADPRRPASDHRATIRFRNGDHEAQVLNISSSGAMIESALEPFIGEPIEIRFENQDPVAAVARWVAGRRIGVEFGAHNILVGQPKDHDFVFGLGESTEEAEEPVQGEAAAEREPRQAVIRRGMVRAGTKHVAVRLCNISSHGVMLESEHCLAPGAAVRLEMGGGLMISAQVRWSKGKRAGLSFDEAVNPKGVSSLPNVPAPKMIKPSYLESEFDPNSPWAARFDRLTMRELSQEPAAISDEDVPASWQRPAQ